jgi:integrase
MVVWLGRSKILVRKGLKILAWVFIGIRIGGKRSFTVMAAKIKTKRFERKAHARAWMARMGVEYNGEKPQSPESTYEDLLEKFTMDHLPTIKESTRDRYLIDIRLRITPYFRFMKLSQMKPATLESFRAQLLRQLTHKSVNNCLDLLSFMLKKAERWEMIPVSPFKLDRLKIEEHQYKWWKEKSDISRFLLVARRECPHFLAYKLALECGMRLGEIIGLSKEDIDFKLMRINIRRQWLDKHKRYGSTKSGKPRTITISERNGLVTALKHAVAKSPHPECLFVTSKGTRLGCRKLSSYFFKKVVMKSNVPDIIFHDMRHTFASWFMIEGGEIWTLKNILGHSDVVTTQKYAHHAPKYQKIPDFDWDEGNEKVSNLHPKGEVHGPEATLAVDSKTR